MKIFLNIESYFPEILQQKNKTVLPIFNCFIRSIGTVLKSYGYGDVLDFMLCRNLNFYWGVSDRRILFDCETFPTLMDIEKIDNVKIVHRYYKNGNMALDKIKLDLSKNIPQSVNVDQYYIPGFIYYKKEHNLHNVLLIGIDNNSVFMSDLGIVREINIIDFINSLSMTGFSLFEYNIPMQKIKYDEDMIKSLIERNVQLGLLEEKLDYIKYEYIFSPINEKDFELYSGVYGIRKFADDIINIFTKIEKEKSKEILSKLGTRTYNIVVQRYWHIAFLESSKKILKNESLLSELIKQLKCIVHDWKVIRNMFHKASVKNQEELLLRIQKRIYRLADTEENFLTYMKALV